MEWSLSPAIFRVRDLGMNLPTWINWYELRWYSLLFVCGFLIGYMIMQKIYKDEGKNPEEMDRVLIYMVLATVIGARLGHVIFYEPHWITENPLQILKVWEGGLASHGAAILIPISLFIYSIRHPSQPFLWLADRVAIVVALAGSFIRLGNFCNSELIGTTTDAPWGIVFKLRDNLPRHPVQLYEAAGYLAIFFILMALYRKYREKTPRGLLTGWFFILVFSHRFFMEFFKTYQAQFLAGSPLRMGQILSIPAVLIGLFLIFRALTTAKANKAST